MSDPKPFLIGGEWRTSDSLLEVRFPYSDDLVAQFCLSGERELEDAVVAAQKGFEITRTLPAHVRSKILYGLLDQMEKRTDELIQTMVLEGGKTCGVAAGETARAKETVRVAAVEAKRINGEIISIDWTEAGENRMGFIRHLPLGPVLGIAPFNYPLNLGGGRE
jgi:acyl-CoA reductase-like NAD-dependent aldehyde dehydrogenase